MPFALFEMKDNYTLLYRRLKERLVLLEILSPFAKKLLEKALNFMIRLIEINWKSNRAGFKAILSHMLTTSSTSLKSTRRRAAVYGEFLPKAR